MPTDQEQTRPAIGHARVSTLADTLCLKADANAKTAHIKKAAARRFEIAGDDLTILSAAQRRVAADLEEDGPTVDALNAAMPPGGPGPPGAEPPPDGLDRRRQAQETATFMDEQQIRRAFTYHALNADQLDTVELVRANITTVTVTVAKLIPNSRERSTFITLMQQALMMANAAVSIHGDK